MGDCWERLGCEPLPVGLSDGDGVALAVAGGAAGGIPVGPGAGEPLAFALAGGAAAGAKDGAGGLGGGCGARGHRNSIAHHSNVVNFVSNISHIGMTRVWLSDDVNSRPLPSPSMRTCPHQDVLDKSGLMRHTGMYG